MHGYTQGRSPAPFAGSHVPTMDAQLLDDVYDFWFGDIGDADVLPEERLRYWMAGGEVTDREIRAGFGDSIARAAAVQWPVESLTREQAVGLVVLFDQFPRNCYRTSGEAFAYDHLARDLVRTLEASDWSFTLAERFFLGLPYVHHEDMASQDRAVFLEQVLDVGQSVRSALGDQFVQAARTLLGLEVGDQQGAQVGQPLVGPLEVAADR